MAAHLRKSQEITIRSVYDGAMRECHSGDLGIGEPLARRRLSMGFRQTSAELLESCGFQLVGYLIQPGRIDPRTQPRCARKAKGASSGPALAFDKPLRMAWKVNSWCDADCLGHRP